MLLYKLYFNVGLGNNLTFTLCKRDHVTGLVLNDSPYPGTMIQGKMVEEKRKLYGVSGIFLIQSQGEVAKGN